MELAKRLVLDIASVSQGVIYAATEHASRRGFRNVQCCHFRLEKEMQKISVAAEGILGILDKSSLPNGPPLDDRLQEWFSTDELPTCLDTLHQMAGMLSDDAWMNTIFNFVNMLRSSPPEDKINAAIKLFDSRRSYFYFLLTTDVWNCEEAQQQSRVISANAQDGPDVELVLEPSINSAIEVGQDNDSDSLNTANTFTIIERRERSQMDDLKKLDDTLLWLDGLSCAAKQEETLSLWQPDTCTWLHSTPEYEAWRNSSGASLWLQGKPGSGKTVLTSFLVDSLKNKRGNGEELAYFYCDFRNDRSTSAAEVMRSLLSQLLRHICDESIDPGDLVVDLVREKNGDAPILNNVKRLATFVSQTVKQFRYQPLVIVDALDECKDVEKLLDGLLTLARGGIRLFVTSRPLQVIKDTLCGIPSISMDKRTSAVSTDIALHITRELDSRRRLRDLESRLKMEIHAILCDRADGMFRWVQCQIDTLHRCATRAEVREALDNLPIGLDETYRRILVAIDLGSPEGKLALRALVWLTGALRPLRSREILEGLTIDLGRRTMDRDTGPMHKGALLDACGSLVTYNEETDILILSHFSVKEYLTGDLTRIELPRYHISYQGAHERLARFCICYVTLYLKHVHGSGDNTALPRIMRIIDGRSQWSESASVVFSVSQELLGYVFTNGFSHLAYLGSANHVVLHDLIALGLDIQRYPDAWEVIYQMSQHHKPQIPWPSQKHDFMFYILIAFSSASLFLAFLRRGHVVLKPRDQTNPLVYAAHFDKAQHAEMLLSRGAKVNERGLVVDASRLALPLETAVRRRQDAMVDLLLSAGSIVPKQLFTLSTYYYKYPARVVRKLLETDQFVEWAAEPGNKLPSPLRILEHRPSLAQETDIIFIIQRLVQVGVDHTEHDSAQRTALYFAILGGYKAIVVYLLLIGTPFPPDFISVVSRITSSERIPMLRSIVEAGANVHARVSGDDTTLHLAITFFRDDCLDAVKILVGAGCNPFARNAAGKTPLHLALEKKSPSVADYLLSQGTPPSNALLAVVESRCSTTWRLGALRALVDGGADIHGITQHEDALLHREMMSPERHQLLEMERLPAAWCDPSGRNTSGDTPLGPVIDRNPSLLADYLLATGRSPPSDALFAVLRSDLPTAWKALTICSLVRKGADVRTLSADGNTLLHAVVLALDECQGLDVTQLLIDAGCDPFRCSADGKSPLHIALDREFSSIADYLLSTGKPPPPDALFAILHSALPADWRAQTISSVIAKGVDACGLSLDGNVLLYDTLLALDEHHGLDVIKLLICAGCTPFQCTVAGEALLRRALNRDFLLVVDYLLSIWKPLPPEALFAILHSARPDSWRAQTICSLVGKGADIHGLSADGDTLLHAAVLALAEREALDVTRHLIDTGHNPSVRNRQGKTALHFATEKGSISVVEYILSWDKSLPNDILFSALESQDESRVPMLRMLISKGSNVRVIGMDGNNLLHAAISSPSHGHLLDIWTRQTVVKILVESGCDAFARNSRGETPLHLAVAGGYFLIAEHLLSIITCPPVTIPPFIGTPPHLPADILAYVLDGKSKVTHASLQIFDLLTENGANIDVRAADGGTLLHTAIKNGQGPQTAPRSPSTTSFRPTSELSEGAARLIEDGDPFADWLWPRDTHQQLDVSLGEDINTSFNYQTDGVLLDIIELLVGSGCDPSICDANGHPPTYFAVLGGHVDVVEFLLPITVPLPWQNPHDALDLAPQSVRGMLRVVLETWESSEV